MGVRNVLEVADALLAFNSARVSHFQALHDYSTAVSGPRTDSEVNSNEKGFYPSDPHRRRFRLSSVLPFRRAPVHVPHRSWRREISPTVTATGKLEAVTVVGSGDPGLGYPQGNLRRLQPAREKGRAHRPHRPRRAQGEARGSEANLAVARASAARARANLAESDRNLKRGTRSCGTRQLIARSELDAVETTRLTNRASVQEADARVLQVQASLRQAETNLEYTKILSPEDGVIISRR